jgi:hypothetical protein
MSRGVVRITTLIILAASMLAEAEDCFDITPIGDICRICTPLGVGGKYIKCDTADMTTYCVIRTTGFTGCGTLNPNCPGTQYEYANQFACDMNMGGVDVGTCQIQMSKGNTNAYRCGF